MITSMASPTTTCHSPGWWGCWDKTTSGKSTGSEVISTTSTSSCKTPGWFGCYDKLTTAAKKAGAHSCHNFEGKWRRNVAREIISSNLIIIFRRAYTDKVTGSILQFLQHGVIRYLSAPRRNWRKEIHTAVLPNSSMREVPTNPKERKVA